VLSADPDECRAVRRSLDEAAKRHGRPPLHFSFMETTLIGRTRDELLERAGQLGALHFDGISGEQLLAERVDGWVCGTLDEVAGQFEDLAAAGLERAMLQHLDHRDLDAVRMIGEQLAPRVAGL
ncbi:MAG TPA: hypothetical protein VN686_09835, partial [Gaiellales bacterium]|nr:hypothetical protein [Gaiellales bacterium]